MAMSDKEVHNALDQEEASREASSWKPSVEEETIHGSVTEIIPHTGKHDTPLMFLNTGSEVQKVWLSTVLKAAVDAKNVVVGDEIAIRYKGKRENDAGTEYANYVLTVLNRKVADKVESDASAECEEKA